MITPHITVNMVIFITLAMPAALLVAAAVLARTVKPLHENK